MKVTLTPHRSQQILRCGVLIRIKTSDVCTQIRTSCIFDPYREIYIWPGQIRDSRLPARMIIDEEGRGVELFAERVNNELINIYIEPWHCRNDNRICLNITLKSDGLIRAFCDGILEFIRNRYYPSEWCYADVLSNLNWNGLLQLASLSDPKWQTRLAIYGGGEGRLLILGVNG